MRHVVCASAATCLLLVGALSHAGMNANRPPSLLRSSDFPLHPGHSERYEIFANDPDGDPIAFRKVRGPSYLSVKTLDAGHGSARGELMLSPDSCARGKEECVIEASDGVAAVADTFWANVLWTSRAAPRSPMQDGAPTTNLREPSGNPPDGTQWIVGEWEWRATLGMKCSRSPYSVRSRIRLVFRGDNTMDVFTVGADGSIKHRHGTYSLRKDKSGTRISMPTLDGDLRPQWGKPETYDLSGDSLAFGTYPSGYDDACSSVFVRVPSVLWTPADTSRVAMPMDGPRFDVIDGVSQLVLPKAMEAALRIWDPAFRPWTRADSRGFPSGSRPVDIGASSIIGDFDGDLLPDAAILGQSGADQVIVALLSDFGNVKAAEVAWRKFRAGRGLNKSRGDPSRLRPIHLEMAPRGTRNLFCWVKEWDATPIDAIGIVEQGIARFDYVLRGDRFVLFAPVEGSRLSQTELGRR